MFKTYTISTNEELTNLLLYCRVIDIGKVTFIFSVLAILSSKYLPFTTHDLFYVVIGIFILTTLLNIFFHNETLKKYPKKDVINKPFEASIWELYITKAIDVADKSL